MIGVMESPPVSAKSWQKHSNFHTNKIHRILKYEILTSRWIYQKT